MGGDAPVVVEVGAPSSSQSHTSPRSLLKVTSVAAASAGPSAKETVPSGAPSPVQVGATSAPSPSEPPTPPEPAVCSDAVGSSDTVPAALPHPDKKTAAVSAITSVRPRPTTFPCSMPATLAKHSRRTSRRRRGGRCPVTISLISYTHLRAHETDSYLVCRLLL